MAQIHWKDEPENHDYAAARDFLSLLLDDARVGRLIDALRNAPTVERKGKDLLRASRLPLLPPDNVHVRNDLDKIESGRLSPVLLVRGNLANGAALVIADGYHRICAIYHHSEDAEVSCRLVGVDGS
jgi:hypothetical protein